MGQGLLVAGTTSDAGKSVVTTGICRALARRGLSVAPFKAQNMSNNSMVAVDPVTGDGVEIGRAQWIQAVAARAVPEAAMNPVLLKPGSDRRSHVVVLGRPAGHLEAGEFAGGRKHLAEAAFGALDDLRDRFDVVVCEGAGSAAEINLRAHDYVNMGLARHGDLPTVLVGDIDRGGVFAAMYGTLALLDASDQALVRGFVINKFRGDLGLLRPGLESLEKLTGRPVLGVLPWQRGLWLDSEDSLALSSRPAHDGAGSLTVAVVMLPRISNFTDVDALCLEPDVRLRFVDDPRALAGADVVILPGTRATLADLAWLRGRGLDTAVADHARRGGVVLGICGGFQMLGRRISDPHGVEGTPGRAWTGSDCWTCTPVSNRRRCCGCRPGRRSGCRPPGTRSTTAASPAAATRSSSAAPGRERCSAPCGTAASRATPCARRGSARRPPSPGATSPPAPSASTPPARRASRCSRTWSRSTSTSAPCSGCSRLGRCCPH